MAAFYKTFSVSIFFTFLFGIIPLFLFSQEKSAVSFERITSENVKIVKGLSQNSVYCMLQDELGYLWLGTWDGLNKYDGYSFTIYNMQSGMSGQTIYEIFEDSEGLLWVGTDGGLNKFNREQNKFTHYTHSGSSRNEIANNNVSAIVEDKLGNLWMGTHNGLSVLDKKSETFTSYLHTVFDQSFLRSNYINDLCFDVFGNLWIATQMGLVCFDPTEKSMKRFYHIEYDKNSLPGNRINCLYPSSDSTLWIGTDKGLSNLHPLENRFNNFLHKENLPLEITALLEDFDNHIWIGTNGSGVLHYNLGTGKLTSFTNQSNNLNSLSHNRVLSLYEDRNSIIWVGTFIGVNKYNANLPGFKHYRNLPNDTNTLNSNYIISIFEDKNEIAWIATDNGINLLDRKTGDFEFIQHDPGNPNTITTNNLRVIKNDGKGRMWIGTFNKGVDLMNLEDRTIRNYSTDPRDNNTLSSNAILSIYIDKSGEIWVGTNGGGLNKFNEEKQNFTRFKHNDNDPHSISDDVVWTIQDENDSLLWIGTGNGLNLFNKKQKVFLHIEDTIGTYKNTAETDIFSIYKESDSILWLGTKGNGLEAYNINTGLFRAYNEKDGLPNNVVYAILEDNHGFLWLSTNWGLSRFDNQSQSFINYDVRDGIQSNEFNHGAYYKNEKGEMYFGGMNGFNLFNPEEITRNTLPPKTVVTTFEIFNRPVNKEFKNGDTIVLKAQDNFFSMEFSALDFSNPEKNRYMYKLENYDKEWTYTDARKRFAEYTDVNAGSYVFKVRGSNNDNIWDEQGTNLTIIVVPHWYNTWLFRGIALTILFVGLWVLIERRIQNIRNKHQIETKVLSIEKQLFDTELQALRLQMNPHFIFNSLNSIQSFILNNDTDKAVNYLGMFSHLMRLILTNSRESYITVAEELKALRFYMDIEQLRFDDKFSYEIIIDKSIDEEFMEIPPMLIQPYVENAIIHGLIHKKDKGKITIRVCLKDDHMLWIVEDNGIGREEAMRIKLESGLHRKSRGMLITMERLEVLNKKRQGEFSVNVIDLKNKDGSPAGTRVELKISYIES